MMNAIADFLFEAASLKRIPRTGYQFLGAGRETVAEHTYICVITAYVLSQMTPEADGTRLLLLSLVHDLPESRIGDLNAVQKSYVSARESIALKAATAALPFGDGIMSLMEEVNKGETLEARLAKDADQLAFVLDLKCLLDCGHLPAKKWLAHVKERIKTPQGQALCHAILSRQWDDWWLKNYVDSPAEPHLD